MDEMIRDVRGSVRTFAKKPGFAIIVVMTLASGIAANTAIFSVVNGVLLRALPYRQEDRIVTLWGTAPARKIAREKTSPANYFDWLEQGQAFEALGMAEPWGHLWTREGEPEAIRSWVVTPGFFEALGTQPLLGRGFLPFEYLRGSSPVVIVGYEWWQRHLGGDPSVIGEKLTFNNQLTAIVGVMPPEFEYPPGRQVWAPRPRRESDVRDRGTTYVYVVGRLKPGRTLPQAQQEMSVISARQAEQYPQTNAGIGVSLMPLHQVLLGDVRPALLILFGAVSLVLLIACANVANVSLARYAERQREFAIRGALGASRGRIVRQLMTESLILAGLGGAGGVLLAKWLIRLIAVLSANHIPRLDQVHLSPAVVLFALVLSVLTTLLFGLAPALHRTGAGLQEALKEGSHTATAASPKQRFRQALVVIQIAVAFVLLGGAGLLVRSFLALLDVNPGFAANSALALEMQLARRTADQRIAFLSETLDRVAAMPGVRAAGAASALPFSENQVAQPTTFRIEGRPSVLPEGDATANLISVTPDYFRALGVPLLSGRWLTRFDTKDVPVAIINHAMAQRWWPAENPLGNKISFRSFGGYFTTEIVGVVGDMLTAGLEVAPAPEIFVTHASTIGYPNSMTYFVRTEADPLGLLEAVKDKIRESDKNAAFSGVATINQLVERSLDRRRFSLLLLALFALLALGLAAGGLFGLISLITAERTHEIGVRVAFGAGRGEVLKLVLRQGMRLTVMGIAIGLVLSLSLRRLMQSLLFGVTAADPVTFLTIGAVLIAVPLLACYLPALRATRVDPVVALRA